MGENECEILDIPPSFIDCGRIIINKNYKEDNSKKVVGYIELYRG